MEIGISKAYADHFCQSSKKLKFFVVIFIKILKISKFDNIFYENGKKNQKSVRKYYKITKIFLEFYRKNDFEKL